jgi:hypothetical protein
VLTITKQAKPTSSAPVVEVVPTAAASVLPYTAAAALLHATSCNHWPPAATLNIAATSGRTGTRRMLMEHECMMAGHVRQWLETGQWLDVPCKRVMLMVHHVD